MDLYLNYILVFVNDEQFATIKRYQDSRHPNRKWCYEKGMHTYYSETAETLNDIVREFIQNEIDWSYCAANDMIVRFDPKIEEDEE